MPLKWVLKQFLFLLHALDAPDAPSRVSNLSIDIPGWELEKLEEKVVRPEPQMSVLLSAHRRERTEGYHSFGECESPIPGGKGRKKFCV